MLGFFSDTMKDVWFFVLLLYLFLLCFVTQQDAHTHTLTDGFYGQINGDMCLIKSSPRERDKVARFMRTVWKTYIVIDMKMRSKTHWHTHWDAAMEREREKQQKMLLNIKVDFTTDIRTMPIRSI